MKKVLGPGLFCAAFNAAYERRFGSFARTVGLPQGSTEDAIKASYKDGVLEIHVPKPEQVKPRKIEIAGDTTPPTIDA